MKKVMTVALLAAGFAISGATIAAETQRFAPIDPKAYSPEQQEFAKLMTAGPRAGTITNAPFKVYFASPDSASKRFGCPIICAGGRGSICGFPNLRSS